MESTPSTTRPSIYLVPSLFILLASSFHLSLANGRFGEYCLALTAKSINCSSPVAKCLNSSANYYGYCECKSTYKTLQLADPSGRYLKTDCLKPRESNISTCTSSLQCQFEDPLSLCVTEGTNQTMCKCRELEGYKKDPVTGRCVGDKTSSIEWLESLGLKRDSAIVVATMLVIIIVFTIGVTIWWYRPNKNQRESGTARTSVDNSRTGEELEMESLRTANPRPATSPTLSPTITPTITPANTSSLAPPSEQDPDPLPSCSSAPAPSTLTPVIDHPSRVSSNPQSAPELSIKSSPELSDSN